MAPRWIQRWVFSPLESVPSPIVEEVQANAHPDPKIAAAAAATVQEIYPDYDVPVCRQYAQQWEAPWHENGFALVNCTFDPTHLAAAQADPRLFVFGSITDSTPIPDQVQLHFVDYGLQPGATLAQLLSALEHLHVNFMPEQ